MEEQKFTKIELQRVSFVQNTLHSYFMAIAVAGALCLFLGLVCVFASEENQAPVFGAVALSVAFCSILSLAGIFYLQAGHKAHHQAEINALAEQKENEE